MIQCHVGRSIEGKKQKAFNGFNGSWFSRPGIETPRLSVQVLSQNRSRYRNLDILSLRIGTGIKILAPDLNHTFFAVFTLKKCFFL